MWWALAIAACGRSPCPELDRLPRSAHRPPSFVVIVLDDVGIDKIDRYAVHPDPAPTPTFDRLAREGLLYRNAYALPTCSATRGALLTGRQARRTGMGSIVWPFSTTYELPLEERTLPEVLADAPVPYCSAMAGKWHLSSVVSPSGTEHPRLQGFSWYAGSLNNLWVDTDARSGGHGYYGFEKVDPDGVLTIEHDYATTDTTDDAVDLLRRLPEPFFLLVAYNAAHNPWHSPPIALQRYGTGLDLATAELAMIEAADTEMGRLLDHVPDDAVVVVLADNGTSSTVVTPPSDPGRAKGTVYEGGVRVPLVVRGPGIPAGSETGALFHVVDLLPTLADLAGVDPDPDVPLDGTSQRAVWSDPDAAVRGEVYVEALDPTGPGPWDADEQAVRDDRYKLVRHTDGGLELFDLRDRAFDEGPDLLLTPTPETDAALARLLPRLDAIVAALTPP